MSLKKTIPFGLAFLFFLIATVTAWYEGSGLVDNTFEWKHTAVITSWLHNGEVEQGNISQLDFFIYSIKFKPIFPIIMLVSMIYMIVALGHKFISKDRVLHVFISSIGILLLVGATLLIGSPNAGAKVFMFSQLIITSFLIGYSVLRSARKILPD